jgi:hypothetical protein
MHIYSKLAATAAVVVAASAFLAGASVLLADAAAASVVCNAENQCWHTHREYSYLPAYGVVVHPDGWKWGGDDHYVWREHRGRGYWRNGVWVTF